MYLGGFFGAAPTQYIKFDGTGITIHAANGQPVSTTGPLVVDGEARVTDVSIGGKQVVGAQRSALPPAATDLATAVALVNAMRTGLSGHGLFAP